MDNVSKVISGQDKYRKCECESGSEENISSVFALAPTLALFSVPRTDKSCNQLISICYLKAHNI